MKEHAAISIQAFRRMPDYYNYIKALRDTGVKTVSAPAIARQMGLNEVQVRKDLAAVSQSGGRPRTGFAVAELLESIGACLGYNNIDDAVLVGAGQLGRALLAYKGFEEKGVRIVAAFDADPALAGAGFGGKKVLPLDKLAALVKRMKVHIGIITVPAEAAQEVCDLMVQGGILAVWNFAPVLLKVPEGVLVQNENMAAGLALLSQHLADKLKAGGAK